MRVSVYAEPDRLDADADFQRRRFHVQIGEIRAFDVVLSVVVYRSLHQPRPAVLHFESADDQRTSEASRPTDDRRRVDTGDSVEFASIFHLAYGSRPAARRPALHDRIPRNVARRQRTGRIRT